MTQSWILIANPVAGGGRARAVAEQATLALQTAGQAVELRYTHEKGHGTKLARQAVREHTDRLIVCGGDGTIGEVLPALAGSQTALGLLPFGTANDLARALAVPRKIDAAVHCLLKGQPRPIDLGQVGDRFFATVAAFGFDAEISALIWDSRLSYRDMAPNRPLSGTTRALVRGFRQDRTRSIASIHRQYPQLWGRPANRPWSRPNRRALRHSDHRQCPPMDHSIRFASPFHRPTYRSSRRTRRKNRQNRDSHRA